MKKIGIHLQETSEGVICWDGKLKIPVSKIPRISTYSDHRMAMAFAPAAMINRSVQIEHPDVVEKSYPKFWDDLKKTGFVIGVV
jgi:3-phosphoshikimate 1-carboxyvinyltransferase